MRRREFIGALPSIVAGMALCSESVAAVAAKPLGSPNGPKMLWRLERGKWVRRRMKAFRVGDEIVIFNRGEGMWGAGTWAARGEIVRAPDLQDCGEYLDWGCRATFVEFELADWQLFVAEHKLNLTPLSRTA